MSIFLFMLIILILIDTDSETVSNKINCTNQQLNNRYNHADQSFALLNQPKNVLHFVVQDQALQIKEEYLECALLQLYENHLGSVIIIPINSQKGFSQNLLDLINMISDKFDVLFYIAQHPLNNAQYQQSNEKIIYTKREKEISSSEFVVLLGIRTIL